MKFYRVIKDFEVQGFPIFEGDIVVDSSFHWWRKAKLATPTTQQKILNSGISFHPHREKLQPLTRDELLKIKPHISNTLLYDYKVSMAIHADEGICLSCGQKANPVYNGKPKSYLTKGQCPACGQEDTPLHKLSIFGRTSPLNYYKY